MGMTRTPDEIKKGLECCTGNLLDCESCPYSEIILCQQVLKDDALSLIQQLQDENAEKSETIMWMEAERDDFKRAIQQLEAQNANLNEVAKRLQDAIDQWELVAASPGAVEDMARENTELLEKVEQLQAEIEKYEEAANKCCYESQCNAELNQLEALCKRLREENEKLQAERDAAVADLRQASIYLCCACKKYHHAVRGVSHHYCEVIGERADFTGAISCGMFEWRGVAKEDGNG